MGGGLLQLITIGAQDVYITGDPQITFFKLVYRRHTNFALESRLQQSNLEISSERTVTIDIKREADLINHMYLRIENPITTDTNYSKTIAKTLLTNIVNQNLHVIDAAPFDENMDIMITAGVKNTTNSTTPFSAFRTTITNIDYANNILTITGKYPVIKDSSFVASAGTFNTAYKFHMGFILQAAGTSISAGTACPFEVVEVKGWDANSDNVGSNDASWFADNDIYNQVSGVRGIINDTLRDNTVEKVLQLVFVAAGTTLAIVPGDILYVGTSLAAATFIGESLMTQAADTPSAGERLHMRIIKQTADIVPATDTFKFAVGSITGATTSSHAVDAIAIPTACFTAAPTITTLDYVKTRYDVILEGSGALTNCWSSTDGTYDTCCRDNITGYNMIEWARLDIGGDKVDLMHGDVMDMWSELNITNGNKKQFDLMADIEDSKYSYLPLYFWFNKTPGLALPLIALQYNHVELVIKWSSNLAIKDQVAKLYVDYVFLDSAERRRFAQSPHEYLIETWDHHEQQNLKTSDTVRFYFNHPIKEIMWRAKLPNNNYCSWDEIKLKFNNNDRISERHGDYFMRVQPYYHHSSIPSKKSGIHVYSFALKPEEHQPSGTCNFSRLDDTTLTLNTAISMDGRTTLDFTNLNVKLNIYSIGYNILRISSGMGGLAFAN